MFTRRRDEISSQDETRPKVAKRLHVSFIPGWNHANFIPGWNVCFSSLSFFHVQNAYFLLILDGDGKLILFTRVLPSFHHGMKCLHVFLANLIPSKMRKQHKSSDQPKDDLIPGWNFTCYPLLDGLPIVLTWSTVCRICSIYELNGTWKSGDSNQELLVCGFDILDH